MQAAMTHLSSHHPSRRSRRGGFTLIELLVVIAIIAILAAIIMAVYSRVTLRARLAEEAHSLGQIATAAKLYQNELKAFPLGSLQGNIDTLPDDGGSPVFTSANYNTYNTAGGPFAKTRVGALFPEFLDQQEALISPGEEGDTVLATSTINGQQPSQALKVGNVINSAFSSSSFDDMYNVFGYSNNGSLGKGTPIVAVSDAAYGAQQGRQAKRLNNRFAPGDTIVTYSREFERKYDPNNPLVNIVRLSGQVNRLPRNGFDWQVQTASQTF